MIKISKNNLDKLETLLKELGYIVRYEKGNFNSGYCIVETRKVILVNKFFDLEARTNTLLDILSQISAEEEILSEKSKIFFKSILKNQEELLKDQ